MDNEKVENTAGTSGVDEPIKNSNGVALKNTETETNSRESYEEVEEKVKPVKVCDKEDMIQPEEA